MLNLIAELDAPRAAMLRAAAQEPLRAHAPLPLFPRGAERVRPFKMFSDCREPEDGYETDEDDATISESDEDRDGGDGGGGGGALIDAGEAELEDDDRPDSESCYAGAGRKARAGARADGAVTRSSAGSADSLRPTRSSSAGVKRRRPGGRR